MSATEAVKEISAGDRDALLQFAKTSKKPVVELRAPNGAFILGTLERLSGRADATACEVRKDGTLEPLWGGYTEVYWDDQQTEYEDDQRLWVDESGDVWKESELIAVPVSED